MNKPSWFYSFQNNGNPNHDWCSLKTFIRTGLHFLQGIWIKGGKEKVMNLISKREMLLTYTGHVSLEKHWFKYSQKDLLNGGLLKAFGMPMHKVNLQEGISYGNLYFQQKSGDTRKSSRPTALSPLSPVLECHSTEARTQCGSSIPGWLGPHTSCAVPAMLAWVERGWHGVRPLRVSQVHKLTWEKEGRCRSPGHNLGVQCKTTI